MSFKLLPFAVPVGLLQTLRSAYAKPTRPYHNLTHVDEVLVQYATIVWQDPGSVALAVLFHDAIYQAGRTDNETRSAQLAFEALAADPPDVNFDSARVQALIMLTARHGALEATQLDHDEAHFLDCDMAILGAPHERFASYELAIAAEYGHLPPAVYRAGRARFLHKLLSSPAIYLSRIFRERLESQARTNLQWALATLSG